MHSWVRRGLWLAAALWAGQGATVESALAARWPEKDFLRAKVRNLTIDPSTQQPVVVLADSEEERAMIIWIGPCEANAISVEIQGTKQPRPSTHDLAGRIIQRTAGNLLRIMITHSKENTYYATIALGKEDAPVEIDARPSDSIALALQFKAPIYVAKKLFDEMSVPLAEKKGAEELYGLTIQELTRELAQSFSFRSTKGVLVADVREGSQAQKDDLKRGDIFAEVGGKATESVRSLQEAIAGSKGSIKAKVFRKGGWQTLTLHPQ